MAAQSDIAGTSHSAPVDIPPGYADLLRVMSDQLRSRRGLILRRLVVVGWPVVLTLIGLGVVLSIARSQTGIQALADILSHPIVHSGLFSWGLFVVIYSLYFGVVYAVEKSVWLVAIRNQRPLESKQSWRIAKRIALPYLLSQLALVGLYFALPFALGLSLVAVTFRLWDPYGLLIVIPVFATFVGWFLRFGILPVAMAGFVFLDQYGPGFSMVRYLKTIWKISEVASPGVWKRVVAVDLGTASVTSLISLTSEYMTTLAPQLPAPVITWPISVPVVTRLATGFANEMLSFARLAAYAHLYQTLRGLLPELPRTTNDFLFSLADRQK